MLAAAPIDSPAQISNNASMTAETLPTAKQELDQAPQKQDLDLKEVINLPNRRIALELNIQADTRESLLECLDSVRHDVVRGVLGNFSGGAIDFGYVAKISDDGFTTPQQYAAELRNYLESIRREGC